MYLERGYREREIPGLVLSRNLHGMEIDPRAAQIARLALAMCARGMDRRFFGRGVQADIAVLAPVALGEGDIPQGSALEKRKDLVDALAHLDEAGSLLAPGEGDLAAIREAIELTGSDGLFGSSSRERLQRALDTCEVLSRRHDCVVANPPYMGSSSFGPFMSRWVKKNYPDVKSDLCTCFIERGFNLAKGRGYAAMITMQSWMFLGSFEKMRSSLIGSKSILSMLHLGPRAFDAIGGEVVNVTADVVYNGRAACEGAYVRLVDINGSDAKRKKALEAIGNPDCGWFYRRDAETFKQIPGTPIAYWLAPGFVESFSKPSLKTVSAARTGMATGRNEVFLRLWPEVSISGIGFGLTRTEANESGLVWFPYAKGGEFRKWYGNRDYIVNWFNDGHELQTTMHPQGKRIWAHNFNLEHIFHEFLSWSDITVGASSFRYFEDGFLFDSSGTAAFLESPAVSFCYLLGLLNTSFIGALVPVLNPTMHFTPGDYGNLPFCLADEEASHDVTNLVENCLNISKSDYDSFETSWDFKCHPLI